MNSEEKNGLASNTGRMELFLQLEKSKVIQLREKVKKTSAKLDRTFRSFLFDLDYLIRTCTEELDELSRLIVEVDEENEK